VAAAYERNAENVAYGKGKCWFAFTLVLYFNWTQ